MRRNKGQQSQVARPLDRRSQGALVPGAGAALAARRDFTPVRYIVAQYSRVLIIDILDLIPAKETDFTLGYVLGPARSSGSGVSCLCHSLLNIFILWFL